MTQQLSVPTLQPFLRILSDEQIQAIHIATLEILEKIGVEFDDPHGKSLLLDAGAWESGDRVKIPEKLVNDAIQNAPSRIPMYTRLGELTMPLELGKVFFGSGSDVTFVRDVYTGERRRAIAQDVVDFARLADALDNIDFVMSMSNPVDVPPDDLYLYEFIGIVRGSIKPNVYTVKNRRDLEDIHRIGVAIAGSEQALREKPFFLLYPEPISPLLMPSEVIQKILFCAEKGIPTAFVPSANPGGGGPITLAGALALGNAECLVGLILTQLVRPGTPFLYGFNTASLDMKTTIVSYGSPEWSMGMAACNDLARHYNLPVWGFGGATDSKVVDAQAGAEYTFSLLTALLSRTTLVHDVGYIEYGAGAAMEALVIADEIISMARVFARGIEVNPTTLALDAIARVKPGAGFLADDHTLEHWREAQWKPNIVDRSRYQQWDEKGRQDMNARANARARDILADHQTPPLSAEAEAAIADVLGQRAAVRQ
ncbi:MAG: trimethylamine methyltransferase [Chloroflexi bacterium]|nr:trimethylamine methyltransferase [Chloroflexota bacterium]